MHIYTKQRHKTQTCKRKNQSAHKQTHTNKNKYTNTHTIQQTHTPIKKNKNTRDGSEVPPSDAWKKSTVFSSPFH